MNKTLNIFWKILIVIIGLFPLVILGYTYWQLIMALLNGFDIATFASVWFTSGAVICAFYILFHFVAGKGKYLSKDLGDTVKQCLKILILGPWEIFFVIGYTYALVRNKLSDGEFDRNRKASSSHGGSSGSSSNYVGGSSSGSSNGTIDYNTECRIRDRMNNILNAANVDSDNMFTSHNHTTVSINFYVNTTVSKNTINIRLSYKTTDFEATGDDMKALRDGVNWRVRKNLDILKSRSQAIIREMNLPCSFRINITCQ